MAATTADIQTAFKFKPVKEKHENNLLTTRETEVLALTATGKSNSEIAQQLHITIGTVRVHVHAILQKLEVRDRIAWAAANRTSATIMAIQQNFGDYGV